MEEMTELKSKLCESEDTDDFSCVDCAEFDSCQMILYDSYDEFDDDRQREESGLTIV